MKFYEEKIFLFKILNDAFSRKKLECTDKTI